jgi:hypothetical protein
VKLKKQTVDMGVAVGYMPEFKVQFKGGDDPNLNDPTRLNVFQCMASSMLQSALNQDEIGGSLVDLVNNTGDPTGGAMRLQLMSIVSDVCVMLCDNVLQPGYLERQHEFMQEFARKAPELKQKFQDAADELGSKLEAMAK